MEPSFLSGWKSPQSMEEQMKDFMEKFADAVDERPHVEKTMTVEEVKSWFSVPSFLKGKKEMVIVDDPDEVW